MSSLQLPRLFRELEKLETWPNVEASFSGSQSSGEHQIDANGLFLFVTPKSGLPPFFVFIGNYTPMQDPMRPAVHLQHMQQPSLRHELVFHDNNTRDHFTAYFFKSLAALEALVQGANMLDFCRGERVDGLLPGESYPIPIMCVLQSNGKDSFLQGHVLENGKVRPGFNLAITRTTDIAPLLSVPDPLKHFDSIYERAFAVGDITIVCGNREAMMGWVVSGYMAAAISVRKAPRRNPADDETNRRMSYSVCLPDVEDESPAILLARFGIEDGKSVKCRLLEELECSETSAERRAVLLAIVFANGVRDKCAFVEAIAKIGVGVSVGEGSFERQVSKFVVECARSGVICDALKYIAAHEEWQSEFYEIGAFLRFPGLCETVASVIEGGIEWNASESMLDDLPIEDELRYLHSSGFKFLEIAKDASMHLVKAVVDQLENGLKSPDLKMTRGAWAFISECVSAGGVGETLADTYAWVSTSRIYDRERVCPSKLEELVFLGIERHTLCDWIRELGERHNELAQFYESDSTLRDPVKLSFIISFLEPSIDALAVNKT